MNRFSWFILLSFVMTLVMGGCGSNPTSQISEKVPSPTIETPAASQNITPSPFVISIPSPTPIQIPKGKTIVVTSWEDSGAGSLRQAMEEANAGDTINFNSEVFPSDQPKVIFLQSQLPGIAKGNIAIDASDAGVIIDGSKFPDGWDSAFQLLSPGNTISGIRIVNFSGAAIQISGGQNNLIKNNIIGSSDFGIGLWGVTTSGNKIVGNYIGVMDDGKTPLSNKTSGVLVQEEAHDNQIGPDNEIAFNSVSGIAILHKNSTGNTIFQNRIHDNGSTGINISGGGNNDINAPFLVEFDLSAGNVKGITCPNCEVLLYSDSGDEGSTFEGQTTANDLGAFAFDKGIAFKGAVLTATATDPQGNTSPFSLPTSSKSMRVQLQADNNAPFVFFKTRSSDELENNRLAGLWAGFNKPDEIRYVVENEILPIGLKVVRMTFNEGEYFSNTKKGISINWNEPECSISPELDQAITDMVSHKLIIQYKLMFWDKANHPDGWEVQSRFTNEEEISRYLEYIRFIVTQFKGRFQYYELWNEPDINVPLQHIAVEDYINLAKRAIPLIHEIDPDAKVIVGSTSGLANPEARDYLFSVLHSEIMPMADAIDWHPLYGVAPDGGQFSEYYKNYPALLEEIMSTARGNGFKGEFIASEITYSGPGCDGCDVNDPVFSDIVSAKYTARGLVLHLGNDVGTGAGGLSSSRPMHFRIFGNLATIFAGAKVEDLNVVTDTGVENIKVFTFNRSDGSKLVAFWTDKAAVEEDPGVKSTIKISDFAGWNATGIDILHSIQQKLITSNKDGNLVIPDFFIKDYPTIIRLTK